jgi:hypothetical protein
MRTVDSKRAAQCVPDTSVITLHEKYEYCTQELEEVYASYIMTGCDRHERIMGLDYCSTAKDPIPMRMSGSSSAALAWFRRRRC